MLNLPEIDRLTTRCKTDAFAQLDGRRQPLCQVALKKACQIMKVTPWRGGLRRSRRNAGLLRYRSEAPGRRSPFPILLPRHPREPRAVSFRKDGHAKQNLGLRYRRCK